MTKLTNGLTKGQGDGLASLARLALRAPRRRRLALVVLDCSKITVDTETAAGRRRCGLSAWSPSLPRTFLQRKSCTYGLLRPARDGRCCPSTSR